MNNVVLDKTLSFKHFDYVFTDGLMKYIFNSIFIALIVSIVGTIIAYFTAYVTVRTKNKASKFIHIFTIASIAIPGIVLGLAYTITFSGSFIYNTFIIYYAGDIVNLSGRLSILSRYRQNFS